MTARWSSARRSLASLVYLAASRPALGPAPGVGLPVAALTALAASLPFVAGGGLDVMGSYVNNDLAFHLYNAEWLRSHEGIEPQQIADGYPIGPHGLVDALAGADRDRAARGLDRLC